MDEQLDDVLARAAGDPDASVDVDDVRRRVRQRRRRRRLATGTGASLLVVAVVAAGAVLLGSGQAPIDVVLDPQPPGTASPASPEPPAAPQEGVDNPEGDNPSPGATDQPLAEDDLEVLAVRHPSIPGESQVIDEQAELDAVWTQLQLAQSPPVLASGQAALVLSVRGDCDASHFAGMERIPAVDRPGDFAAVNIDASCVNTEYGRHGGEYDGPHTLYVIATPNRLVDELAGVQPVTAAVSDFQWEFLAAATDPQGASFPARADDQAQLDYFWERSWELQAPAPDLPQGWASLLVPVPGTCTEESQLREVQAVGHMLNDDNRYDEMPALQTAVSFDPACAEVLDDPGHPALTPRTVYAIIVPDEVAETLGRLRAYITCVDDENIDECEGVDDGPIDTDTGQRGQVSAIPDRQATHTRAAHTARGTDDAAQQPTQAVEKSRSA